VDPVTHTLVGVCMGNAFFRGRWGSRAVTVLAIASNLPDIDAAVHLTGDPAAILMRRTFGHSLILLPLWVTILALLLRRLCPQMRLRAVVGLCALGAGVHLFFDLVNSFGVVLLWPLSDWRPELAIIFIIDLVLTGLLAAPLILAAGRRARPRLAWLSRASLLCVAVYVALCACERWLAVRALAEETRSLRRPPEFSYVFPEPLGPHRWRGVVRTGEAYRVYLIRSISGMVLLRGEIQTWTDDPRVRAAAATPLGRRLEWFFKAPVWQMRVLDPEGGNPWDRAFEVTVFDLRFASSVLRRDPVFVYSFRVHNDLRVD
jgi:membrane-bound metal-dependent hydrolase YbcI (DUF457 family)